MRTEQENKKQAEAQRKRVRRSQSNTRAQSVRRTSLRDKGLTARRDAVEEARMRLQADNPKVNNFAYSTKIKTSTSVRIPKKLKISLNFWYSDQNVNYGNIRTIQVSWGFVLQ